MNKTSFVLVGLLVVVSGAESAGAQQAPPAELTTVLNYVEISDRLTTAGQIAYDQIPLLREDGYEVVVNLATADQERNSLEGFHVTSSGMSYIHIPVVWEEPQLSDVRMFFDVMEANKDRKLFVHCIANMRVSAFVYLYRTLVEGVSDEDARVGMDEVWTANQWRRFGQWSDLIERAQREFSSP
jgi:protein tyrosine phosphatase (PTP) superfamily phosphohydrolase (DUF442 family)